MGLANWVVGKMVDSFLAQPPEEKAAVFETMATKFWDAATPEETATIARLLMPKFMEAFLASATAEQKAEITKGLLDSAQIESMTAELLPGITSAYLGELSPDQWRQLMPAGMMPGMPGGGASSSSGPEKRDRPKPPNPGGMMPW